MFCDQLAYLRKRAGLTQEELAEALGMKRATIAMYEIGKREPNFETLELIADYFNTTMDFLVGIVKQPKQTPELSKDEETLIQLFRSVPVDSQKMVLEIIQTVLKSKGLL